MTDLQIWTVILGLALGSFTLRFSFLGIIGNRKMPEWLLRHLRYTAVAFIPALIIPITTFTDEMTLDWYQIIAGAITLGVSIFARNIFWAILFGAGAYIGLIALSWG